MSFTPKFSACRSICSTGRRPDTCPLLRARQHIPDFYKAVCNLCNSCGLSCSMMPVNTMSQVLVPVDKFRRNQGCLRRVLSRFRRATPARLVSRHLGALALGANQLPFYRINDSQRLTSPHRFQGVQSQDPIAAFQSFLFISSSKGICPLSLS